MPADERQNPDETEEKVEDLEDLEAGEDDAAAVKGGGPKSESSQTGSDPENRL